MADDLASLGLAVDTSQIDAANKSLGNFVSSGKNAQLSADVLAATAVRLGISIAEVQRRLAAANDNMSASAAQAMKLADATKQVTAANDNLSGSLKNTNEAVSETGQGFFSAAENALTLVGHLKLLALGAYAMFPAFRGVVNSGLRTALSEIIPVAGLLATGMGKLISALSPMLSFFSRIAIPITIVVGLLELIHATWTRGAEVIEKYSGSLRKLYSDDVVRNLEKLTRGQTDIISAEQVARATELGMRMEDVDFRFKQILKTSFDLTDPGLKMQSVWISIKEYAASTAEFIITIYDKMDGLMKKAGNSSIWDSISGRKPGEIVDLSSPGEASILKEDLKSSSIKSATDRLSAMMGVAALAAEALNKTARAAGDLDKELDIGSSFIARYSDAVNKLASGAEKFTDNWDRVVKSIERHTAALESNAASAGKSVSFRESLRVETQLLTATYGGLNAATDQQIDDYVELRVKGVDPLTAANKTGMKVDAERIATMEKLGKAAGEAKTEFEQVNFAIANQRALDSDKISIQALTAYSAVEKGIIADKQKRLELEDELRKGIATQAQVDERAASARKLVIEREIEGIRSYIDLLNKKKFLSGEDATIVDQLRAKYGNDIPAALASTEAAQLRIINAQKMLSEGFNEVGKSMFSAFLSGKNIMDAMVQSLDNLAKKLADSAFDNILTGLMTGNLAQAGIGAAQAGASALISLFTGDQRAKKQREEAEAAWKKMALQVDDFNRAAAGFDLGPLTNELRSMMSSFESLRRAADEAGDATGAARLNEAFMSGTRRIVDEFKAGAQELSPLQTAITAVNDEFRGLTETLISLNYGSLTIGLDEAAAAQIRNIIKKYTDQLNDSLEERLNIASGRSFINDANALMKRRQSDLALAAELGNDPATISKITAVFHLEAQKIVNDAGLVGSAFDEFIKQFPSLAGVVVQANEDMTASAKQLADQMNASARSITDYVNGLFAGSGSTLSPTAQLTAAQSTYNAKLALAQAGNADAQSTITQDAENLRQAARSIYASGSGYQNIFNQITSQLLALPAVQGTTDPVVQATRDVLTAINAGNSTQATQATLAQVNTNTSATTAAAQSIAALQSVSNALSTTANSLVTSSNAFLTAINTFADRIIQAINSHGSLMAAVGNETNLRLGVLLNWQPLIVYGPNTAPGNYGGTGFAYSPKAMGGWIEGGIPGRDSVPLASGNAIGMPGEFVIRNAVAQANASWLPAFNRTGQMPSNDNGGVIAELRMLRASNEMMQRQIAQMVYDAGEKSASATRFSGEELRSEMRMRKRDQRTA